MSFMCEPGLQCLHIFVFICGSIRAELPLLGHFFEIEKIENSQTKFEGMTSQLLHTVTFAVFQMGFLQNLPLVK